MASVDHCMLLTTSDTDLPGFDPPPPTSLVARSVRCCSVSGVPVLNRSPRMPPISASARFEASLVRSSEVALTVAVELGDGGAVSVTGTGAAELKTGSVTLLVNGRMPSTLSTL